MKVDKALILVLQDDSRNRDIQENDVRDGYALGAKFMAKHGHHSSIDKVTEWKDIANGAGFELAGHTGGQIGKHNALLVECRNGGTAPAIDVIHQFFSDAKTCGIYLIMHGSDGLPTPYSEADKANSPSAMASLINSMCPKIKLLKVNIVGCTLARLPANGIGGKVAKKTRTSSIKQGSWAAALCKELKRKETLVAAYSGAVYVVRENNPEFQTFGVSNAEPPKNTVFGQKAVNVGVNGDNDIQGMKAHRAQVKKVYQYGGGILRNEVNQISLENYKKHQN